MKHVTFGDKSLLMDDDAADTLLEYARLIGDASAADSVTLRAIGPDGNTIDAGILLNTSTNLIIESTNSDIDPPDNSAAVSEMRERIDALTRTAVAHPEEDRWSDADYDSTEFV
jgi:hypothetical protein